MTVAVKICGLRDIAAVDAAAEAGAKFIGFVFDPQSRRRIAPEPAAALAGRAPPQVKRVGLFVDADDETMRHAAKTVPLDILQLHGGETPARVADIRARSGLPVIAVLRVATAADLVAMSSYEEVADYLLFDTKIGGHPTGGTGKSFDWRLLQEHAPRKPWLLAGGLNAGNIAEAMRVTGAKMLDVSSGVEDETGHKSPAKIRDFIRLAQSI